MLLSRFESQTDPLIRFSLKYLSLAESGEESNEAGAEVRGKSQAQDARAGTRLPHLSGRKPLHRRNTDHLRRRASYCLDGAKTSETYIDRRKQYAGAKAASQEPERARTSQARCPSDSWSQLPHATPTDGIDRWPTLYTVFIYDTGLESTTVECVCVVCARMTTLELAEALLSRDNETERVLSLLEALQRLLERATPTARLRELVMRALYAHVDSHSESVLAAIARAMLTMRVMGSHLSAACKLVFKVARNDKNDHLFKNSNLLGCHFKSSPGDTQASYATGAVNGFSHVNRSPRWPVSGPRRGYIVHRILFTPQIDLLVEGCGRACPLTEGECCVYGAGALRFLTLEPKLRARAQHAGALHLAALHLKIINTAKRQGLSVGGVDPRLVPGDRCVAQPSRQWRRRACEAQAILASGALPELIAACRSTSPTETCSLTWSIRLVKYHTLTESEVADVNEIEITASAVGLRPVSESSDGPLPSALH
ncbi:Armadillo repeat-containing protein 2 [Eumeta japonica]|uniref:Armadillo repeat-containing protein 2 n=1 Tax=Eumeta variegata TaxID=151549 RepID=A0A4C1VQV7_EUMVA|nr:Armadillo repeat-containing protein 2 [Eumeta japonica]